MGRKISIDNKHLDDASAFQKKQEYTGAATVLSRTERHTFGRSNGHKVHLDKHQRRPHVFIPRPPPAP